MEKEYAKDYPIPFHNDVFFKYMLIWGRCRLCIAEKQNHRRNLRT
ncbi:hypothetical protein HMPREF9022_04152, partial [Erysipelotrichaceae bacterium 2_2_44A]